MEITILRIACMVSVWFAHFYYGRFFTDLDRTKYFIKGATLYIVGLATFFGMVALGASLDLSATSQEWGVIGLEMMAFFGSSIGGGYFFEKRRRRRSIDG